MKGPSGLCCECLMGIRLVFNIYSRLVGAALCPSIITISDRALKTNVHTFSFFHFNYIIYDLFSAFKPYFSLLSHILQSWPELSLNFLVLGNSSILEALFTLNILEI